MPRGDGTGPEGMGPMTGRAAGYCAGYDQPGFIARERGRGWHAGFRRGLGYRAGMGRGLGFGHGHGPGWSAGQFGPWAGPPDRQTEAEYLKSEADSLQRHLENIRARLEDIEKDSADDA